ncbi:hypothetical protein [Paenibacillus sp. LHD-38]|uniref:hypothetical protein n=1 Tax=Paenibacillus sp. LHD-38 TaxID=3072143 RepID=UPI00280F58DC|nr:hypothetical protein [Paenibacillus sp. LHD-38]MDQ8735286.1 hypothetical protein [Paenibacillus sp. LHD-38]
MANKKIWMCIALILVLSTTGLFSFPTAANACICVKSDAVLENKSSSDAVFEGTATSVKASSLSVFRSDGKTIKASFQVNEVWKGHVAPSIEVLTADAEDSCGFAFKEGERYLVYATATGKSLVASCSATVLLSDAGEHIELLGSGSLPPQPDRVEQVVKDSNSGLFFLSIGAAAALAIIILFFCKRKQIKSRT